MDKSVKDSFVQEVRNEITHRIKTCETLRTDFEEKLPDFFSKSRIQKIYMLLSIITTIAFAAIGMLFSKPIGDLFSIHEGFILAMFLTFTVYFLLHF